MRDGARALRAALGAGRTAYHVAATQFAFLSDADPDRASYLARLDATLPAAHRVSDVRFSVSTTMGVTPIVLGEIDPRDVLRTCYSAVQDARGAGEAVGLYAPGQAVIHARRFELLRAFGMAL